MARIACLMMQKDETLLLRPWLLHHGYLFGYENLFVYDNGSTSPEVCETLAQFKKLGVNVDSSRTTPQDFADKGNIITAKIQEFKQAQRYDVALPLDCDEFAAVAIPGGYSCARNDILHEMQRINWHSLICRTSHCLYSLPGQFDVFQQAGHEKCAMAVRVFDGIDHGFHQAKLPEGGHYHATSLIYLHLHYRPFAAFMAGARAKLSPWTDPYDLDGLKSYQHVGQHLVRYLFMDEAAYYALDLGPQVRLNFTGLADFLAAHMDATALRRAWCERAVPGAPVPLDFPALRLAGLRAMQADDQREAGRIWALARDLFPAEEDGYLYGALAARAAGDEALRNHIHAAQAAMFPEVFS